MSKNKSELLDKPIIFLGFPRSGTSIISDIIFQHEDLAWPSNYSAFFPDKMGINKLRQLLDNQFWQLRGQKKQLNKVPFYNKYLFKPGESYKFWEYLTGKRIDFSRDFLLGEKATPEEKKRIRSLFDKMIRYQKRSRLAFKITGPGRVSYLHSIFPDAVFVEITRTPYAAIRSSLEVGFWKGKEHELFWKNGYTDNELLEVEKLKKNPALLVAYQYNKIRYTTQNEFEASNTTYYSLPYENFIKSPKLFIAQLCSKTGLRESRFIKDFFKKNQIYNRNKEVTNYFSKKDRKEIRKIISEKFFS